MISRAVEKTTGKSNQEPDWRNTYYQFHASAVPKYNLRPFEIAIFNALLSAVKGSNVANGFGTVQMSNTLLMERTAIKNRATFRKARDRLIETGVIDIARKGTVQQENTTYLVKMLGSPKPR